MRQRIIRLQLPVIRRGDIVRVSKPIFVVRVGYPKCIESETEIVIEKFGKHIDELLGCEETDDIKITHDGYGNARIKLARRIAYARLRLNGFGGRERKVYTKELPELKGVTCYVCHIRYAKTGTYYAPWGYGEDYEPGGLGNQKTHKILMVYPDSDKSFPDGHAHLEIEACNVLKVVSRSSRQTYGKT